MGKGGKNHSESSSSSLQVHLKQGHPKADCTGCVQILECLRGGRLHSLFGQPVSVHGHHSKVLPYIQIELAAYQFLPIASCPVAWRH